MAGTVYILLALTAILTISNTSAAAQNQGQTKDEYDAQIEELKKNPKEVVNKLKTLAGLLNKIKNQPNSIKTYLKNVDTELKELDKMLDKTEEQNKLVEKLEKLLKDLLRVMRDQDVTVPMKDWNILYKQLLNQPKELIDILKVIRDFSNLIVTKPKMVTETLAIVDNWLNQLDGLKNSAVSATAAVAVVAAGLLASLPLNMVA